MNLLFILAAWLGVICAIATPFLLWDFKGEIMSAISDFAAKQTEFQNQIDAAVAGIADDVRSLNGQIAALQASSGAVTPEDQALLDGIQARSQAVADKLTALDSLTPPVVPTV